MHYTIQMASQISGLSQHVIRIWERRYAALVPDRTCTNRRLYCQDDVERLTLLRRLTEAGHRIRNIAKLPTDELRQLEVPSQPTVTTTNGEAIVTEGLDTPEQFIEGCLAAAAAYEADLLRRLLNRARLQLGQRGLLHRVICPLIQKVGESWQQGLLRPGQEHVATGVIREILSSPVPGSQVAENAPELVVATPAGEIHEMGALLVAASARDLGWRVTYLGASLPIEEISACACARKATAVALSVVYPEGCQVIEEKLRRLRTLLPGTMAMMVGGRAAASYRMKLADENILWAGCLHELDRDLLKIGRGN
ncbi:MAG: MerR family transcriptional regulator [Verrucomicrobiales bacterium]|nr:MerR family transcriptional regulator [Verrucomicrobiales bacterium]MCP5559277.1 MerR family transcriptional regulator [Verrucomicrobiaceae bacterium]